MYVVYYIVLGFCFLIIITISQVVFLCVWIPILLGFSGAFFIQFHNMANSDADVVAAAAAEASAEGRVATFGLRVKSCFDGLMGEAGLEDYMAAGPGAVRAAVICLVKNAAALIIYASLCCRPYAVLLCCFLTVQVLLQLIYLWITTIMLLNLLIAMMSETFAEIAAEARKTWKLEQARIILHIEQHLMSTSEQLSGEQYWINVKNKGSGASEAYVQVYAVNEKHFGAEELAREMIAEPQ